MKEQELVRGKGRTRISLSLRDFGEDLVVFIYNKNAHIGAVAVGEYDSDGERASTSVITRLGHKEEIIAQKVAYIISKSTKRPSCVIVGVHIDDITTIEIKKVLKNVDSLVQDLLSGNKYV